MSLGSEHFCGTVPLRAARQSSATAPLAIFFRGYLTNQTELALQVGLERAVERCVVDVIGACYARWERSLPAVLDGQFALVIVNRLTGDILLTRDALGVVPLYWSLKADTLRFATRVRDLVDNNTRNDLNLKEVRRFILFGAVSNDTVYSAIKRLDPRTSVWIHNGSITHDVTWDPRSTKSISYKQPNEYIEHFVDLVDRSVQGSLRDCESGWISLSGGLDSNTVLPSAIKYCPELRVFSIVAPQWPEEDESRWIERIVTARRLPWHPINAEDILPFSEFPEGFCGSPDTGVIHQRFRTVLNQLVGPNVFLTGDGGDSFMGSQMGPVPSHLADPIFSGDRSGLIRDLIPWMQQSKPTRSKAYWLFHALVLPSLRHFLRRSVRPPHYHLHPPWLSFGKRMRYSSRAPQPRSVAPRCQTPGQQAILDDLWQCAEDPAFDRLYASRHPLFNRPLFEFLWAIPWSQKCLPLCDRYLQRRALKGLIDDDIRTRIGYGIGTKAFVEGLRRSKQWQDYLCESPKMAELGLVDPEKWRQAIRQASVGLTKAEPLLVRAIGVEVWLKQLSRFRLE
jgi:asparagine synthetase B (glutamine-hydrolysing)